VLNNAARKRWGHRLWLRVAAQGRSEDSVQWVHLRRAVSWRAVARAPLQTTASNLHRYLADVRLRLNPSLPWMAVLGPDGSGKSTLVAGLCDTWPRSLGSIHTHHLRPHRLNRRGGPSGPVVDPHGQPPRGIVTSTGALMFVVVDWWIGYWTHVARQRANQGFVVFDRHLLDVSVDPRRYRYGGAVWLVRVACRFVPRPDVIVVLDASPAVVRARKQEVSLGESRRQSLAYRRLAARTRGAHLVDASMPSEQVLEAVMVILRREIHARSERRGSHVRGP
jgi:thymidylate kinase